MIHVKFSNTLVETSQTKIKPTLPMACVQDAYTAEVDS